MASKKCFLCGHRPANRTRTVVLNAVRDTLTLCVRCDEGLKEWDRDQERAQKRRRTMQGRSQYADKPNRPPYYDDQPR